MKKSLTLFASLLVCLSIFVSCGDAGLRIDTDNIFDVLKSDDPARQLEALSTAVQVINFVSNYTDDEYIKTRNFCTRNLTPDELNGIIGKLQSREQDSAELLLSMSLLTEAAAKDIAKQYAAAGLVVPAGFDDFPLARKRETLSKVTQQVRDYLEAADAIKEKSYAELKSFIETFAKNGIAILLDKFGKFRIEVQPIVLRCMTLYLRGKPIPAEMQKIIFVSIYHYQDNLFDVTWKHKPQLLNHQNVLYASTLETESLKNAFTNLYCTALDCVPVLGLSSFGDLPGLLAGLETNLKVKYPFANRSDGKAIIVEAMQRSCSEILELSCEYTYPWAVRSGPGRTQDGTENGDLNDLFDTKLTSNPEFRMLTFTHHTEKFVQYVDRFEFESWSDETKALFETRVSIPKFTGPRANLRSQFEWQVDPGRQPLDFMSSGSGTEWRLVPAITAPMNDLVWIETTPADDESVKRDLASSVNAEWQEMFTRMDAVQNEVRGIESAVAAMDPSSNDPLEKWAKANVAQFGALYDHVNASRSKLPKYLNREFFAKLVDPTVGNQSLLIEHAENNRGLRVVPVFSSLALEQYVAECLSAAKADDAYTKNLIRRVQERTAYIPNFSTVTYTKEPASANFFAGVDKTQQGLLRIKNGSRSIFAIKFDGFDSGFQVKGSNGEGEVYGFPYGKHVVSLIEGGDAESGQAVFYTITFLPAPANDLFRMVTLDISTTLTDTGAPFGGR
ncbi:MAG: hypothetical protein NUW37_17670 [Planctomycetes bacterium]|nr:hypothetical protein [Planctomycetota bacterium]